MGPLGLAIMQLLIKDCAYVTIYSADLQSVSYLHWSAGDVEASLLNGDWRQFVAIDDNSDAKHAWFSSRTTTHVTDTHDSDIFTPRNTPNTVKPFNLAALKVGDLACKIILAPFILAN